MVAPEQLVVHPYKGSFLSNFSTLISWSY